VGTRRRDRAGLRRLQARRPPRPSPPRALAFLATREPSDSRAYQLLPDPAPHAPAVAVAVPRGAGAEGLQVEADQPQRGSRRAPRAEVPLAAVAATSLPTPGPHAAAPAPRSYRRGPGAAPARRS
jgi:hypothetical protein